MRYKIYNLLIRDVKSGRKDVIMLTVVGNGNFKILKGMAYLGNIRPEGLNLAEETTDKKLKAEFKEMAPRCFEMIVDEKQLNKNKFTKLKVKKEKK